MPNTIHEADWKQLRQLAPVALERMCQRILEEIEAVGSDHTKSYHQRYLDVFQLIKRRDKEIAQTFDELRRSTALYQLTGMYSRNLLTEEEFSRFSQETRDFVQGLLSMSRE